MPSTLRTATTRVNPEAWNLRASAYQGRPDSLRPYARLPHDLAADPRLLPIDVRLLLALVFFARDKDHCWPADATLGSRVARSRATVQRRLRYLEGIGLIARHKADDNPTGRVIRLSWRTRETPPVSRSNAAGASPVRHELDTQKETSFASPPRGEKPKIPAENVAMTPDQLRTRYAESGWLDRPSTDPLRRLAERRLAQASGSPPLAAMTADPASRPRSQRPGRRGLRGPRPLFGG